MKFKVGDKVKVIKCKTHSHCENINKISKIKEIKTLFSYPYYLEDCDEPFDNEELELVENQFTKADLKDGDIVTYRNGDRRLVNATTKEIVYIENTSCLSFSFYNFKDDLTNKNGKNFDIVKVERPVKYETLFERKEEILDETEKRYLASVIRPFRDKVEWIKKCSYSREYIRIELKDEVPIDFPYFKKGTMYKGMKKDKEYILKELGL